MPFFTLFPRRRKAAPMVLLTPPCTRCGEAFLIDVSAVGYVRWLEGVPIQAALPDLSIDDRELLLTGICAQCWVNEFPVDANDQRW